MKVYKPEHQRWLKCVLLKSCFDLEYLHYSDLAPRSCWWPAPSLAHPHWQLLSSSLHLCCLAFFMSFIPLYALSIWRKEDDVFIVNLPTFEKRCETPAGRGAKLGRDLSSFYNHNYYQFAEWMERPTRCLALCLFVCSPVSTNVTL